MRCSPQDLPTTFAGYVCPACGYDLRGLAEPVCPECGAEFDPGQRPVTPRPPVGATSAALSLAVSLIVAWWSFDTVLHYLTDSPDACGCGLARAWLAMSLFLYGIPALALPAICWGVASRARYGVVLASDGFLGALAAWSTSVVFVFAVS